MNQQQKQAVEHSKCQHITGSSKMLSGENIKEQTLRELFGHVCGAEMIDENRIALYFGIEYLKAIGYFPLKLNLKQEAQHGG